MSSTVSGLTIRPVVECLPQRVDIGDRRVDAAVSRPANGEMEHVRPQTVVVDVTESGPAGEFVGTEERRVVHAGRRTHAFVDELVEGRAGGAFREERQHDVPAVAVREPLVGRELRGMTAEGALQIVVGRRQLVARDRHHVLVGVGEHVLVEEVADAGSVGEQMLHGDAYRRSAGGHRRATIARSCRGGSRRARPSS